MISRFVLTLLIWAASTPLHAAAPAPDNGAGSAAERLDRLFADYWEDWLELNPVTATFIGDRRYNDRYTVTIGPAWREAVRALYGRSLDAANAIPAGELDEERRLSRELFIRELQQRLDGYRFPDHLLPMNQMRNDANAFALLGSGTGAQPFGNLEDYENFLGRVAGFSAWVSQAIVNMRLGMKTGIVQPAILMQRVLPQLEAHIVPDPAQSMFYRPVTNFPESVPEADRQRLRTDYERAITTAIVPAYTRLRDFIRDEYLPACRDTDGLAALPDGKAWYAYLVREHTTTGLDPLEIHEIGLAEVERIHGEMKRIIEEVGFDGDLTAFFEHLKSSPDLYFTSREEMVAAYEALRERATAALPRLFAHIPKATFEVRAVEEFREKSAPKGSYQRPSEDGSRPGIFYVNTFEPTTRARWDTEGLFLHEALPGHHLQRSMNLELKDLPAFRRNGGVTAFAEGWGLYAESIPVGQALGFYEDPYQRFGELDGELWRAIRLVVDTGLHAKGWTRQQVLDYMYANSAARDTRAVAEAERFMAVPGQALAYKMGQMKISELRLRAEQALGERFDIRAFHGAVLGQGDLPLDVLEAQVDAWIAATD